MWITLFRIRVSIFQYPRVCSLFPSSIIKTSFFHFYFHSCECWFFWWCFQCFISTYVRQYPPIFLELFYVLSSVILSSIIVHWFICGDWWTIYRFIYDFHRAFHASVVLFLAINHIDTTLPWVLTPLCYALLFLATRKEIKVFAFDISLVDQI